MSACATFKEATIEERWEYCKKRNACFRCLMKRQFRHRCPTKPCGVDSCRGTHHRMLHNSERPPTSRSGSSTQESSCQAVVTSARPSKPKAHLKIVPIRLTGPKANIDTYALLDEGSTITLIDAAVAEAVGRLGRSLS
ncbi:hypothetical protein EVAR_66210_1 [Eumeta japonica]|uniref:Peptidase A2 domain-containing protein n=1 Tax=Eumeta variegata TaxID=151549 RepID=A0A4C1ZM78_EUMVA|nr:hypothetical protein EVAR_66210_1 [Eumeta japonica]